MGEKYAVLSGLKPDLNRLYTEPPHTALGGPDAGWFCREQAYHCFVVAQMLGLPLRLATGEVSLRSGDFGLTTFRAGGHAWCVTPEGEPIDLSVVLRFHTTETDVGPIVCSSEMFKVAYLKGATEDEAAARLDEGPRVVVYVEQEVLGHTPADLVRDPFAFLYRPAPGMPTLLDLFGGDILNRVNLHLYAVATGKARPFRHGNMKRTFEKIRSSYSSGANQVLNLLNRAEAT